jgi:endoglucanase
MQALTDPNDNIIYEMHQYLDSDGSGTSSTCKFYSFVVFTLN